jgi:hypothetical protein
MACNSPPVTFDEGIPDDWSVMDRAGNGVVWTNVAGSGEAANYTGGTGDAASVSSDKAGEMEFDTDLVTPVFTLAGYSSASLQFAVNYQNNSQRDRLDLDLGTGISWATLLSWNEDHGTFRNTPGELKTVDLSAYAGMAGLALRWHYYQPTTNDWDWYAQVDSVSLRCWVTELFGDADCNGAVQSVDALKLMRFRVGLASTQTPPCPPINVPVAAGMAAPRPMGDVDCSGVVSAIDALKVLRHAAGLPVAQETPCPILGTSQDLYY